MSVLCVGYELYQVTKVRIDFVANVVVTLIGVRLMRPIDADLLMENLGFGDTEEEREENVGEIITWEDVDSLPTVFDVEKVVALLEEELKLADDEKARCIKENPMQFDEAKGYARGMACVIEIVKRGGVDEE